MKNCKLLNGALAISIFFFTSCKKDFSPESSSSKNEVATLKKSNNLGAEQKANLAKIIAALPTFDKNKFGQLSSKMHPEEYRDMALRAMKVIEPTPCDDYTILSQWLDNELADWDNSAIYYAVNYSLLDVPGDYALVFENSSANQSFGKKGEYSNTLTKAFKDIKRFWDIQSDQIQMVAMHGSTLRDKVKVTKIFEAYGYSTANAQAYADFFVVLLDYFPQYRNGDHPIFTFNAYANSGFNFPPYGVIPAKIVMGDGIMDGYESIGYGDVAPQAILAHEFGHQIQFQLGLFTNDNSPEATRRTELMADAYSAYYLSHAKGATMQWKRVKLFLQVFFNIGDCQFASAGHHGTPTQRMAAAEWGYHLADDAQKQGHILPAQTFAALFDAQLPELLTH